MLEGREDKTLSILELQEKEYASANIVGIFVAVVLSVPLLLILIFIVWQILIDVGFDVSPR
jgi:hypothetical protein